jgi:hypothetical protein
MRGENVLGTKYQEIMNFAAPRRTLTLGIRASARR